MSRFPWMPPDYSAHGAQLDQINTLVHILMAVLFVGWGIFFLYTLVRFRAGRNPVADYAGVKSHFSSYVEAGVAVFEVAILVGFSIPLWNSVRAYPPAESECTVIRIVAEQFLWNVHYPGPDGKFGRTDISLVSADNPLGLDRKDEAAKDDITTINQLHLPADRMVLIRLSSKDVIHSFDLPYYRVKQDALPGQVVPVWFTPKGASKGEIVCAQLCGLGHYRMRGFITVHPQAEYDQWIADQEKEMQEDQ